MNAIETTNLTKFYGRARGILDMNLSVEEGECFGFIGPNGAGKSTAIRTLLGLIRPTRGQARIFGLDIRRAKTRILSQTGYLPSETAFYPGMKVGDILKLSADLRKKDCAAEAKRLCQRLQVDVRRRADQLSLGNKKKVAIVCAFQHCPRLLILDEPTSGLDPLMQREFFTILRERNQAGATIFLSSHVLSEIQQNCAKAAVIREGRLIACDRVEALAQTQTKRISLRGEAALDGLPGIRNLTKTDGALHFLYDGDMNRLLQTLAAGNVTDLSVTEPDLEEIFFHYYENGGGEK